ncbi:MAG: outer membrane beta-barrel protein [Tannerella sp.]|jgi:outer membrane protein X|nr:outer membrane beta-barrel protein [Tannerella sp.]
MKKLLLTSIVMLCVASGYAQRGHMSVGTKLGYAAEWETVTLGVDYRYNFLPDFRLAPSLTYMLRNRGMSAWYMDMDCHYIVVVSDLFSFYPIGGLGVSVWRPHLFGTDGVARVGLNVGLGAELWLSPEISIGMEMKYNIISTYDQALAAVRVAYHF